MSHSSETSSAADDTALVAALKNGDYAAFESIYLAEFTALHRYAMSLLFNDDAVDAVQDVFFAIWNNRNELPIDTTRELRYYLFRAVRNRAYKVNRHYKVRDRYEDQIAFDSDLHTSSGMHHPEEMPGEASGEMVERIKEVIAILPPRSREILTLRWYHNMPFDKIAQIMEISYPYTHVLHSRALAMIRVRLGLK